MEVDKVFRWFQDRKDKKLFNQHIGMSENEMMILANYNSEAARGIQHSPAYVAQMTLLQERFNAGIASYNKAAGITVLNC